MAGHRRAGAPPFGDAPYGVCRWCGEAITQGRVARRRWHDGRDGEPPCLRDYFISNDQLRAAWNALAERDGLECLGCGLVLLEEAEYGGRKFFRQASASHWRESPQVDHVVPVIDGGERSLGNLQFLCPPCHRAKTAREATVRAARRRGPDPQMRFGL